MTASRATRAASGWGRVISLGLYTITAYGTWAYAYGVMIESIEADTGWSTSALGLAFGIGMALSGLLAFIAGRLLDRVGSAIPFGLHATLGSGLLLAAFSASSQWAFVGLFGVGAGVSGATGFYAITTATAARVRPDRPDRAIAILTMIGAFSSPFYLPLTAWAIRVWPWRTVGRVLVLIGALSAVQAIVFTAKASRQRSEGTENPGQDAPAGRSSEALLAALSSPPIRRMLAVYALAGGAASTVWAFQVPMMVGAGVGVGVAGWFGGLRGFCQIFGRIGLTGAIERFGAGALLRGAYGFTAAGGAVLIIAAATSEGTLVAAGLFAVLAGVGLGAASPLQSIYARARFDPADLGLLMGLQGAVLGLAGGLGPIAGALLRDVSGSWSYTLAIVIAALATSARLLSSGHGS